MYVQLRGVLQQEVGDLRSNLVELEHVMSTLRYSFELTTTTTVSDYNTSAVAQIDDTHDNITEGRHRECIRYAGGQHRARRSRLTSGRVYRPARELLLESEYCRCEHTSFENQSHVLGQNHPDELRNHQSELRKFN
jgi:hypothetical protein